MDGRQLSVVASNVLLLVLVHSGAGAGSGAGTSGAAAATAAAAAAENAAASMLLLAPENTTNLAASHRAHGESVAGGAESEGSRFY